MSLLSCVTTGKKIGAQIHTIQGINGVGKTTWAASFPKPIILDLEDGSKHLDVTRLTSDKFPTLAAVQDTLKELISSNHEYQTVVIDSVESLEGLIFDAVCTEGKVASIELYEQGYGKGYTRSREMMRELFGQFKLLQAKSITVILVAHTQVKTVTDPLKNETYDRVIMRANDKMASLIRDLSDNVFFATYKVFTTKEKGKTKAFSDDNRIMYTSWRAGHDAKNRLELPYELELSYEAFVEACNLPPSAAASDIASDIQAMSEKLDDNLKIEVKAMLEKFKNNPAKLKEVKNRLQKYVA